MTLFGPYGYTATLDLLEERCGRLDTAQSLTRAIDLLDASRVVWLGEMTAFAAARTAAKSAGRRRPATAELARFATVGWPGGGGDGPPVSRTFLRQFGLTASEPEPVRLQRRIRWLDRRLANPPTTARIEWGYLTVVALSAPCVISSCSLGFFLFDTVTTGLRLGGSLVAASAIAAVVFGIANAPRRSDAAWRRTMTDERDALQARLDRAEPRNRHHAHIDGSW